VCSFSLVLRGAVVLMRCRLGSPSRRSPQLAGMALGFFLLLTSPSFSDTGSLSGTIVTAWTRMATALAASEWSRSSAAGGTAARPGKTQAH
jgi:hypothetical protein